MFHENLGSLDGTPISLRSLALALTLAGLTGGEYLPLPRSEGGVFPFRSAALGHELGPNGAHVEACSPSMGPQRFRKHPSGT